MIKNIKKIYNEKIIYAYLLMQPVLDMLIFYGKSQSNILSSVGTIFRTLFLMYTLFYLVLIDKNKKNNILYIIAGVLIFSFNMAFNILRLDNYAFMTEAQNIIKVIYFPIILLFFYRFFYKNKVNTNIVSYAGIITGLSMLFSKLIGFNINCTYGSDSICLSGTAGFFNSANEVGVIFCFILAFSIFNALKKYEQDIKDIFVDIVSAILMIVSSLLIGTKASYLGLILILIFSFAYLLLLFFIKRKKHLLYGSIMAVLLLSFVYILSPKMPVCVNNVSLFDYFGMQCYKMSVYDNKTNTQISTPNLDKVSNKDDVSKLVSNGRDDKKEETNSTLKEEQSNVIANKKFNKSFYVISKEMVGLGLQKSKANFKILEMDFYDLYYSYGLLGFLFVIIIPIFLIINFIKRMIISFKKIFTPNIIMLFTALMAFGISYIAGHVMFNPAVSIYLALSLVIGTRIADERRVKHENKK